MAHDPLHFGMGFIPHNDQHPVLRDRGRDPVNLPHKGAGRVGIGNAQRIHLVVDRLRHPMGTDHNPPLVGIIRRTSHHNDSARGKLFDKLPVMNQRPEGADRLSGIQAGKDKIGSPLHSEAESRRFRDNQFSRHLPVPPAALRFRSRPVWCSGAVRGGYPLRDQAPMPE